MFKALRTCHGFWFLSFEYHHTLIKTPVTDKQSLISSNRKGHCLHPSELNTALLHCANAVPHGVNIVASVIGDEKERRCKVFDALKMYIFGFFYLK